MEYFTETSLVSLPRLSECPPSCDTQISPRFGCELRADCGGLGIAGFRCVRRRLERLSAVCARGVWTTEPFDHCTSKGEFFSSSGSGAVGNPHDSLTGLVAR
jgi:hypothetical protein